MGISLLHGPGAAARTHQRWLLPSDIPQGAARAGYATETRRSTEGFQWDSESMSSVARLLPMVCLFAGYGYDCGGCCGHGYKGGVGG